MKIYYEKYQDRMHKNSFLNIWTGQRYSHIMPEVFSEKYRHTKLNEEIVLSIRKDREENLMSYRELSIEYNIPYSTIGDICRRKTWKNI